MAEGDSLVPLSDTAPESQAGKLCPPDIPFSGCNSPGPGRWGRSYPVGAGVVNPRVTGGLTVPPPDFFEENKLAIARGVLGEGTVLSPLGPRYRIAGRRAVTPGRPVFWLQFAGPGTVGSS